MRTASISNTTLFSRYGRNHFWPGQVYKNDKLYRCTFTKMEVLRGWPEMRAWRRGNNDANWQNFRPNIRLTEPQIPRKIYDRCAPNAEITDRPNCDYSISDIDAERHCPMDLFTAQIPTHIRRLIIPFQCRHWHVLALASRAPGAIELIESNSTIGWLIASNWVFSKKRPSWPMRSARRLVKIKRREAIGYLGFPSTESSVRLLARTTTSACDSLRLRQLRELLWHSDTAKFLRHLSRVDPAIIDLMSIAQLQPYLRQQVFEELSEIPDADPELTIGMSAARALEIGTKLNIETPQGGFRDLLSLKNWIENCEEASASLKNRETNAAFPAPPVAGNQDIIPLTTLEDLLEESLYMHNCAFELAETIRKGGLYLYRMIYPTHATIGVTADGQGGWRIKDIRGRKNRKVDKKVWQQTQKWLEDTLYPIPF